jgi:hypothetical protein
VVKLFIPYVTPQIGLIFSWKMQQSRKLIDDTSVLQQDRSYCCFHYLRLHGIKWLDDQRIRIGKDLEGSSHHLTEILPWHLSGGMEEDYKKP